MDTLANYVEERRAFAELFQPDCKNPILLIRSESGFGKTQLINVCQKDLPVNIHLVSIQLRSNATGVSEIFSRMVNSIGGLNKLPRFAEEVDSLGSGYQVNIKNVRQRGHGNAIRLALNTDSVQEREERQVNLMDAWFQDVNELNHHVLLVIDTFENGVNEVKDWISGPFLARVAENQLVRIVLAGQEVPDPDNIEWSHCSKCCDLYGIKEAEHWLPVVQALGRQVPMEPALTYLAAICHAVHGKPSEIMKVIETFPRSQ